MEEFPVTEEHDQLILMHRNAHFSGSWAHMLRYYEEEGAGAQDDISLERIQELAIIERDLGQDLFPLVCSDDQQKRVAAAQQYYQRLRKLYAIHDPDAERPQLIADLILAEEHEWPAIRQRCIAEGIQIVPLLLETLKQSDLLDPLFPGYGLAFVRVCEVLGQIGDPRAVIPLFEVLTETSRMPERLFDAEQAAIEALAHLGQPAKEFMLRMLARRPVQPDHIPAAMALCNFSLLPDDLAVVQALRAEVDEHSTLGQYLGILVGEA
jgi:hypothetical protein